MTTPVLRAGYVNKLYMRRSGTWYELKIVGDVKIADSPEMIEAPARLDGMKRYVPGQRDGTISFKLLAVKNEVNYEALRTAALAGDQIELGWTDGDTIDTSGVVSAKDWFLIPWPRDESNGAATSLDIEAKPAIKFNGNSTMFTREYWTGTSTTTTTSA